MKGTTTWTWILMLCLSTVAVQSQYYSQSQTFDPKAVKVTNLHFFVHEKFAGEDPTAVLVARANITTNSSGSFPFSNVYVIENIIRIGPEQDSDVIGNAQGLAVVADKNGMIAVSYLDYGFNSGEFNGSSLSIFSRNLITETERELAVVGGRGKFRMAQGFALLKNYFINETNVITDYKVTIVHYEDDN